MSRTKKGTKPPGYDYMSKRPGNETMCVSPGAGVKKRTVRVERRVLKKKALKDAL